MKKKTKAKTVKRGIAAHLNTPVTFKLKFGAGTMYRGKIFSLNKKTGEVELEYLVPDTGRVAKIKINESWVTDVKPHKL